MPFCGPNSPVGPDVTVCPVGTAYAGKPPSKDAQKWIDPNVAAAGSGPSSVTGALPAGTGDNRPVTIGTEPVPAGKPYPVKPGTPLVLAPTPGGPISSTQPKITTVKGATIYLDELIGKASGKDADPAAVAQLNTLVDNLRAHTGSKLATNSSIHTAWTAAVKQAASSGKDVFDIIGGGTGPTANNAPVVTTTTNDMTDGTIESLANTIGMTMLGKAPDPTMMAQIKSAVRAAQAASPDVTTQTMNGLNANVHSSGGFQQADAEAVMKNIMSANPQYGDYQKATTLMDYMNRAIQERPNA